MLLRCTTLSNEPNLLINMSPWEGPVGYLPQEKTRQANKQDALLICWLMQGTLLQSICLGCVLPTIPCVVVSILHSVHLKRTKFYRTLVEKKFLDTKFSANISLQQLQLNKICVQTLFSKTVYFSVGQCSCFRSSSEFDRKFTLSQTNRVILSKQTRVEMSRAGVKAQSVCLRDYIC